MDIKEIALKICRRMNPYSDLHESEFIYFANKLIESYKAELLNEVGDPVAYYDPDLDCGSAGISFDPLSGGISLYTSDQVAAAVLKATKPLEEEVERLSKLAYIGEHQFDDCTWKHRHGELRAQLAAEQLNNKLLRAALNQWIGIAANCSIESGCCCCGESIENHSHPMACGHSPVDMADSVVRGAIDSTDKALSLPASTEALDAYVAEKVKEARK